MRSRVILRIPLMSEVENQAVAQEGENASRLQLTGGVYTTLVRCAMLPAIGAHCPLFGASFRGLLQLN